MWIFGCLEIKNRENFKHETRNENKIKIKFFINHYKLKPVNYTVKCFQNRRTNSHALRIDDEKYHNFNEIWKQTYNKIKGYWNQKWSSVILDKGNRCFQWILDAKDVEPSTNPGLL